MNRKNSFIVISLLNLAFGLLFYISERGYFLSPVIPITSYVVPTHFIPINFNHSLPSFFHTFSFTLLSIALGFRPGKAILIWILLGSSFELAKIFHKFGTFDPSDLIATFIGASVAGICDKGILKSKINRSTSLYLYGFWFFTAIATSGSKPIHETCENNTSTNRHEVLPADYLIEEPRSVKEPGETLIIGNLMFINEPNSGIHVFDNSDPTNPHAKYYINIPGIFSFVVKDNYLYANNFHDLIVLKLDGESPQLIFRLLDIFRTADGHAPSTTLKANDIDQVQDIIVEKRASTLPHNLAANLGEHSIPMKASCAVPIAPIQKLDLRQRLVVGGERIYLAAENLLLTLILSPPDSPSVLPKTETPYPAADGRVLTYDDGVLLVSDQDAVYIYNVRNRDSPLEMGTLPINPECDTVIMDDSKAFIASNEQLGSQCTKSDQALRIFNLTNLENPLQLATAALDNPIDIAVSGNRLFICSSVSGLQEYNISNFEDINLINTIDEDNCTSLKVFGTMLVSSGKGGVTQYDISEDQFTFLSQIHPDSDQP